MPTMIIDMFSDIVCPWCIIGGARLEKAMAQRPDIAFERHWHPYMLNPDQPAGVDFKSYIAQRFGGGQRSSQMFAQVTQAAASEGITFDFDSITTSPNTRDAHRLMVLAAEHDKTWELAPHLYYGHFRDSLDLNDHTVLADLAEKAGLPRADVERVLADGTYNDAVDASLATAQQLRISGVPFFIFNRKLAVSGAQPPEVMLQAMEQALQTA
jgi:predicted DsbA family dithiol-disulfide isomerase